MSKKLNSLLKSWFCKTLPGLRVLIVMPSEILFITKTNDDMNKQSLFKIIFAIIVVANLILSVWNYLKGDLIGFLISAIVVVLLIIVAFGMTKFVIKK